MARQVSRSSRDGYYSEGSQTDYASSPAGGYPSGSRQPAERVQQGGYASQPDVYQQQGGYGYQRQSPYQLQDSYQQGYQQSGYYQQDPYESPRQRQASASGTRPVGYALGRGGRGGRGSGVGSGSRPGGAGRRSDGFARTKLVGVSAILVGLLIGFLATFLVMSGRTSVPTPVSSTLTESQLDTTVVGTYRYDGVTYSITAREAILGSVSLDSVSNGDGTYEAPTADMILAYARNQILAQLVADNGITVTSDEVAAYAEETVGTSDMAAVAAYFNMDEDQAEEIMTEAAAVAKLRASVAGTSSSAPEPPTPPADGDTEVGTAEYADYIIALLGSNWDSEQGTWANTDNAYYTALQNMVFAPGSASYEAAEAAYAVAYQEWQASSGDAGDVWYAYVNQYLDEASIAIATLRA